MTAWHSRPLEPLYPVVFFDALRVKMRNEATVRITAVYLALAVLPDGSRDILGIWIERAGPPQIAGPRRRPITRLGRSTRGTSPFSSRS